MLWGVQPVTPLNKAVGRNAMPLGRDTRVVPSNNVLDRSPSLPTGRGGLGWEPPVRSDAAYRQITLALVKGKHNDFHLILKILFHRLKRFVVIQVATRDDVICDYCDILTQIYMTAKAAHREEILLNQPTPVP